MEWKRNRLLVVTMLLLMTACASALPIAPVAPTLPEPPSVRLDAAPVPPLPPTAPTLPTWSLPKATDVDWRTVWRDDFVNDGAPQPLPTAQLAPAAIVTPEKAGEAARTGLASALLAAAMTTADMGTFTAAVLKLDEKAEQGSLNVTLDIDDPIGRWVHSGAFKDPAVRSVFVVRSYVHEAMSRLVVKFDIAPHLAKLATYNEQAVAYNAKRAGYLEARRRYDAAHGEYVQAMAAWREAMRARIGELLAAHETAVAAAQRAFDADWARFAEAANKAGRAIPAKPQAAGKPFQAPTLGEASPPTPATPIEEAHLLSLPEMRKLLLDTATEAVPAVSIRLGGQFVDAATGLTLATIDAKLVLPAESGKTEAGMLRELVQRLAR